MIEIKCLECKNCTGDSCKVYGSDADKAVKCCADDSFKNYKSQMTREEAAIGIEYLYDMYSRLIKYDNDNGNDIKFFKDLHESCKIALELLQEPERKHGRWIKKSKWQSGRWIKWFECSICGEKDYNAEMYEDMPFTGLSNFCPQCGADMRGEQE